MQPVFVIGVGMPRFGKLPGRGIKDLAAEAVTLALADSGLDAPALEGVWFANSGWGMNGGQDCIRGQVALRPMGIDGVPIVNVENACAGGATALHGAFLSVASGMSDVALAVGVEKLFQRDRLRMFASFLGALDVENLPALIAQARELQASAPPPPPPPRPPAAGLPVRRGNGKKRPHIAELATLLKDLVVIADRYHLDIPAMAKDALRSRGNGGGHSPFMDVYAIAARRHMARYGSTPGQLALIAAKNHDHGALNPLAQIRERFTPSDVLADKPVAFPLTRAMCAPIGDGAAAAIVCSERFLARHGSARAVRIRASVIASGRARGEDDADIATRASRRAYELAALGPDAIHVAEVHDATAFGELHQAEALGFCAEGDGGILAESGATRIGGRIPLNTSGGLEARGHPIAASGLAQIHEITTQLRGEAGPRQVAGARIGMAQNGGGMLGVEEAAMGIHVLEGGAA